MEEPLDQAAGSQVRIDPVTGVEVGSSPTRARIIETAEREFALHGAEGVSLRRLSTLASQNNNYAVQYHFGDKEGLLTAVFEYRLPRIDAMRAELLAKVNADGDAPTVRELIEVLLRPLAYEAQDPDSHYVTFLVRNRLQVISAQPWLSAEQRPTSPRGRDVFAMLRASLDHLPEALRHSRVDVAVFSALFALAAYEMRAFPFQTSGRGPGTGDELPFEVFVTDLFDGAAAALLASPSHDVRAALGTGS